MCRPKNLVSPTKSKVLFAVSIFCGLTFAQSASASGTLSLRLNHGPFEERFQGPRPYAAFSIWEPISPSWTLSHWSSFEYFNKEVIETQYIFRGAQHVRFAPTANKRVWIGAGTGFVYDNVDPKHRYKYDIEALVDIQLWN
ncbi:MAG: hypothetical protein NTV34_01690 [Proteobacteria bacterium]|nr:hypothetical protein [Pseudomonadota bacterium]